ncbi:hypothetical protein FDW81_02860 [Pseudarthrobacter sp. NamB4]|nr:hypothetical protein FDW81_02860 [Pseudarthrobacter sp. NamB4]
MKAAQVTEHADEARPQKHDQQRATAAARRVPPHNFPLAFLGGRNYFQDRIPRKSQLRQPGQEKDSVTIVTTRLNPVKTREKREKPPAIRAWKQRQND